MPGPEPRGDDGKHGDVRRDDVRRVERVEVVGGEIPDGTLALERARRPRPGVDEEERHEEVPRAERSARERHGLERPRRVDDDVELLAELARQSCFGRLARVDLASRELPEVSAVDGARRHQHSVLLVDERRGDDEEHARRLRRAARAHRQRARCCSSRRLRRAARCSSRVAAPQGMVAGAAQKQASGRAPHRCVFWRSDAMRRVRALRRTIYARDDGGWPA